MSNIAIEQTLRRPKPRKRLGWRTRRLIVIVRKWLFPGRELQKLSRASQCELERCEKIGRR